MCFTKFMDHERFKKWQAIANELSCLRTAFRSGITHTYISVDVEGGELVNELGIAIETRKGKTPLGCRISRHITIKDRPNKGLLWGFSNGRASECVDDVQDLYAILEDIVRGEFDKGREVILTGYKVLDDFYNIKNATGWVPPAYTSIIDSQTLFKSFQRVDGSPPKLEVACGFFGIQALPSAPWHNAANDGWYSLDLLFSKAEEALGFTNKLAHVGAPIITAETPRTPGPPPLPMPAPGAPRHMSSTRSSRLPRSTSAVLHQNHPHPTSAPGLGLSTSAPGFGHPKPAPGLGHPTSSSRVTRSTSAVSHHNPPPPSTSRSYSTSRDSLPHGPSSVSQSHRPPTTTDPPKNIPASYSPYPRAGLEQVQTPSMSNSTRKTTVSRPAGLLSKPRPAEVPAACATLKSGGKRKAEDVHQPQKRTKAGGSSENSAKHAAVGNKGGLSDKRSEKNKPQNGTDVLETSNVNVRAGFEKNTKDTAVGGKCSSEPDEKHNTSQDRMNQLKKKILEGRQAAQAAMLEASTKPELT